MSSQLLLAPPIAFIVVLLFSFFVSNFSKMFAAKGTESAGKNRPYACGEDTVLNKLQPDFTQFFHIAFFFTIMHVFALIISSVPYGFSSITIVYLLVALLALVILFRR
jgi:NADH:ubiquinone oxidoreductase subunit 3 (subunit A)